MSQSIKTIVVCDGHQGVLYLETYLEFPLSAAWCRALKPLLFVMVKYYILETYLGFPHNAAWCRALKPLLFVMVIKVYYIQKLTWDFPVMQHGVEH